MAQLWDQQQRPCRTCSKPTTMWCSRCQSSWYCCSDHLEYDWPRHKDECLSLAALSPAPVDPPPSMPFTSATFAAIIFPVDEPRPRIIHVECLAFIEPASSLMNWTPRVREHMFAGPQDAIGSLTIETGISEGAPLRYPLQVFFNRSGPTSHLVNQSVYSLSKGQATQTGGPIIVLKYSGTRRQGYIDASFNDLPTLVSYFIQSTSKRR
ncbi:hypothetical protein FS749_000334 [Ceratobasidium sp. UAMH 11750]|nr:hypothetical protein FS749_000334 [Ceratobasidium sp. UAMH 11750]